jgi:hypothetical protein
MLILQLKGDLPFFLQFNDNLYCVSVQRFVRLLDPKQCVTVDTSRVYNETQLRDEFPLQNQRNLGFLKIK